MNSKTKFPFPVVSVSLWILLSGASSSFACDLGKLSSRDPQTGRTSFANAVPVTEELFVTNEHALLGANPELVITFAQKNTSLTAQVVRRDFHNDLAFLKVAQKVSPCIMAESTSSQNLEITGFDFRDESPSVLPVNLTNRLSQKLLVPGISRSYEVSALSTNMPAAWHSLSGSALMQNQKFFVGLITQVSAEKTALAIPAKVIREQLESLMQGLPVKSKYLVSSDPKDRNFTFHGLRLSPKDQLTTSGNKKQMIPRQDEVDRFLKQYDRSLVGGDPHEGKISIGGDPHEGEVSSVFSPSDSANPISFESLGAGYAVAIVDNLQELKKNQPLLARALEKYQIKKIFIHSIDGMKIQSLFELLQVLGKCEKCLIDGFWLELKNSELLLTADSDLQTIHALGKLLLELEKTLSTDTVKAEFLLDFQKLNQALVTQFYLRSTGRYDPKLAEQIGRLWTELDKKLRAQKPVVLGEILDHYLEVDALITIR